MNSYASELAFVNILYSGRNSSDCSILNTRLLLFYYINSDNKSADVARLIKAKGVAILVAVLHDFFDYQESLHSNICELLSLIYYLSQNGIPEPFCSL